MQLYWLESYSGNNAHIHSLLCWLEILGIWSHADYRHVSEADIVRSTMSWYPQKNSFKVARSSKVFRIILSYPLADLFKYLFMFWLHRHLPAKQVLNSKQSAKGYEQIIWEILRRSGYFYFATTYYYWGILQFLPIVCFVSKIKLCLVEQCRINYKMIF